MKILITSIGKHHDKELRESIELFTKRSNNYFPVQWNIISPPKHAGNLSEIELKRKEGEIILQSIEESDYMVALDERGKPFTSPGLAEFFQSRANDGTRRIVFIIGGAFGLDDMVLKKASLKWSLSALTFPHQLVRLILVEQLYRAFTIMRNERYHHY